MSMFKKCVAMLLSLAIVMQCNLIVYATDSGMCTEYTDEGVMYTYNADGSITATITMASVPRTMASRSVTVQNEDRFVDVGDSYTNISEGITISVDKIYTNDKTLVSLESNGNSIGFYPETTVGEPGDTNENDEDTLSSVEEIHAQQETEGVQVTTEAIPLPQETMETEAVSQESAESVVISQETIETEPASQETTENVSVSQEIAGTEMMPQEPTESTDISQETIETEPVAQETTEAVSVSQEIVGTEVVSQEPTESTDISQETIETEPAAQETIETATIPQEYVETVAVLQEEAAPISLPNELPESLPTMGNCNDATEDSESMFLQENIEDIKEEIQIYSSVSGVGTGYANGTYSSVLYAGAINEYTDVQLLPNGNGVKENIIMHRYTTSAISYVITFNGLSPEISGNTIILYNSLGEKAGEISAPYLLDANGEYNDNIQICMDDLGNCYRLSYTMDEGWLLDATYPVTLDPTIYLGKDSQGYSWNNMEDGYVASGAPNRNYGWTNQALQCGHVNGDSMCLFRPVFPNSINNIADYILVKEVKLYTYVESVKGANTYSVYQLLGDWNSQTVTYNNCPSYEAISAPSNYISSPGWYTWDLTAAASTWFNCLDQMQAYGVLIRGESSGGSLVFSSSDHWYNNAYYTITYYPIGKYSPNDPGLELVVNGNGQNSGSGYIDLNWNAIKGAENYYVGIYNGKEYEYFFVNNTTSWTTQHKGIWPTDEEISNGRYLLHHDGLGSELPMIPAFTYNNAGGSLSNSLNYSICVIPANMYGQAPNPKYFAVRTARLPDTLPPSQAATLSISPSAYINANSITVNWDGITDINAVDTEAVSSLGTGRVQYSINDMSNWINTDSSTGSDSASIDVSMLNDGRHVLYLRAIDSAGNISTQQSMYFYIDRTPPTAPTVNTLPSDWSNLNSINLTWSGISDSNELDRVEYSIDDGSYISTEINNPAYSGYMIDTSTLSDGEHTIRVRAVDIAGNAGSSSVAIIRRDTTAPEMSGITGAPDTWTNAPTFELSWTQLTDTHSGVSLVSYSIDGGSQYGLDTASDLSTEIDISELSDGRHTLLVHFEDEVGNDFDQTLYVYRDTTVPNVSILSPSDGSAVNGTVEVLGTVLDTSLDSWTLSAIREDDTELIIASSSSEMDTERLGVLNCALFNDGEKVHLRLWAKDQAGNENEVTGTVIVIDKSAIPISGAVDITSPGNNAQITQASIVGDYSVDYAQPESEGLLYIDGVYQGLTNHKTFTFDAITYNENSAHTISILSRANDGTMQFSSGVSSYILHSDAFSDNSFLSSYAGVTLDYGATIDSGETGTLISQTITPSFPVLALQLKVTERKPDGTDIEYYYSVDNGSTWIPIKPDVYVPMLVRPDSIQIKAEMTGSSTASPTLCGWALQGVIETNPTHVIVKMLRRVEIIEFATTTLTKALTDLAATPQNATVLYQYDDGVYCSDSFTYDARRGNENETHNIALLSQTVDDVLYGTGANAETILRENVNRSGTIDTSALVSSGFMYALRLEALYSGTCNFSYSMDGSIWRTFAPGEYKILEQPASQVYIRAQNYGGELRAWHIEGVTIAESCVTIQMVKAPVNVTAVEWGDAYYANERMRYYDLSWTDPTPADNTAEYSTLYEVYRNGQLIGTTTDTRYIDTNYIANAQYAVRTIRNYDGFHAFASKRSVATTIEMEAPERVIGVSYTMEEQKQSEFLNKLYGGNYTFSDNETAPRDERALDMSLLGRNSICAYGFEPVNFNTGNFLLETIDANWTDLGKAVFCVERTYNSMSDTANGPFGTGWSSMWTEHMTLHTSGEIVYTTADGAEVIFSLLSNGNYIGGESHDLILTTSPNSREYWIIDSQGNIHAFSGMGLLKYIQWPDGNRIELVRNEDGIITGFVLPSGKIMSVESDKSGHITAIETLNGSMLKYEYQGNNLVKFIDVDGSEIRYTYDVQGRMIAWYDAEGFCQVKNTYDAQNRVIHQVDANGGEYKLDYREDHTITTDSDGNVSEIWYDVQGRTTKTVDAAGSETFYSYDGNNNIISISDGMGATTHFEYDSFGNKIKETAPDGSTYSFQYDANNNLIQVTNPLGNVTQYEYDENNCLIKQTDPDGGITTYVYNDAAQLLSITNSADATTSYEYDGVNLSRSTDPMGNVTSYAYDEYNRLISITNPLCDTTTFAYDGQDNLISITFADGSVITSEYDKVGNLIAQTDAVGHTTSYQYDALRRLVRIVYPDGSETLNNYDANSNLIASTDANGSTSFAEYDGVGRLCAITDAMGNTTSFSYDHNGNQVAQVLANGAHISYNYNVAGRLASVVNAAGERISYSYDAVGNIVSMTAADGGVVEYTYDEMGRLLTETAPNGAVTSYTYDEAGRVNTVTNALGYVTTYAYDTNGNLLSVVDAMGGVTTYTYDALNRISTMTDANGAITSYTYDAVGNLIAETDALGNVTQYTYDENGSITHLVDALGSNTSMNYDEIGNIVSVLQKNGGTVSAEYDHLGNLLVESDALGNTTNYEYDSNGMVTRIIDALGQSMEIDYDEIGNVVAIDSPDGGDTNYTYDAAGRLTQEISATGMKKEYVYENARLIAASVNGCSTRFEYDIAGNIIAVTDAENRRIEFEYDLLGNLTAIIYPDGTRDRYEYDALSRLTKFTPREGEPTEYTYNAMGDVLSISEGNQITNYEYDLLGRTIAEITADGARTEMAYDALGNLITSTDALGNITCYSYTEESLLQEIRYANGATILACYDLVGNLITMTDPEGAETAYEYDPVGRITAVADALGNTTRYEYDPADNLAAITDALGHITSYTYDAMGNLASETDALGNTITYTYTPEGWLETITDAEGSITHYTYDSTGNVLTANYAGEQIEENSYNEIGLLTTVTTEEGVTQYQYDSSSHLLSVTQPNGDIVSYTYDGHGNRLSMSYPNGKKITYEYDEMNRLISVTGLDGRKTTYTYDSLGRRVATDGVKEDTAYVYDEVGNLVSQITSGSHDLVLEYAYDLSGRMISERRTENGMTLTGSYIYDVLGQLTGYNRSDGYSETYSYDAVGNMLEKTQNGVQTTMIYNAANQLIRSTNGSNIIYYSYDANGNLVEKNTDGGAIHYAYNALGLLENYTGADGYSETYTYNAERLISSITDNAGLTTTLTWDILYGEGVVIESTQNDITTLYDYGLERISSITGKMKTEYIYDARGSVAAEVTYNNAWYTFGGVFSRKEIETTSYTPFGEQIDEKTSGFGYNGEYYNAATGQIYLRARFYEPEMNRFSQKDILRGIVFEPTSQNRYLYVQNDPINLIDPSGMSVKNFLNRVGSGIQTAWNSIKDFTNTVTTGISEAFYSGGIKANEIVSNAISSQSASQIAKNASAKISKASVGTSSKERTTATERVIRTETEQSIDYLGSVEASAPQIDGVAVEGPAAILDACEQSQTARIQVIVYDKFEGGVYKGFREQALNSPYYDASDNTNVNIVYVKTAQDFIEAWNAIEQADNLYIYAHAGIGAHSGEGALIFENQAISFSEEHIPPEEITDQTYVNYSYDNLNDIDVGHIALFICDGTDWGVENNIAVELAERTGASVAANTGGVSYLNILGRYYARSGGFPKLGIWQIISADENGNITWRLQGPLSFIGGNMR